jgi:uncharacterized phiE125 gp8 family phage protein
MALVLITPPAIEPVTLAEAKTHLRVEISDDDTYISALIVAARERAEGFLRRALITRTYDLYLDDFPAAASLPLPKPPLQTVLSVKYIDANSITQTLTENTDYIVDRISEPGWVVLPTGLSWPTPKEIIAAVFIRFKAGYGDAAASVPGVFQLAIKQMVLGWYEVREPYGEASKNSPLPAAAEALLWPWRFYQFS